MDLNELRAAFDTKARREARVLDNENRRLKNVLSKKDERIMSLKVSLLSMYRQCHNMPTPECDGCTQRKRCEKMRKEAAKAQK